MKRILIVLVLAALSITAAMLFLSRARPNQAASDSSNSREIRIAAPGVVEAASEEIAVRAEVPGRIVSIPVEEGDHVVSRQVIAHLDDSLARVRLEAAEAGVKLRQADLTALLNGANQLQRREVWVQMKESEAALYQARAELARRQALFDQGAISGEELERARSNFDLAQQHAEEAALHRQMIGAPALDTDRRRAEAALAAANASLDEARTLLAKTTIRAPLAGIVVHKFLHPGEMASEGSPPILTIADASQLRVRAEIDEADVASVHPSDVAYVTAPAYGDRKFRGRVLRIASALGKKTVATGDPTERIDTKVLETLIELDPGASLPLGLRVTCYIAPH
jgi:HlyD family secretion protein